MRNYEVASILSKIAIFLEMDNVQFKPRAYEKAARSIEALEEEVEEIYKKGGLEALMEIPAVGQSIAEKIQEMITTGKLEYYETLKKKIPVDLDSLSGIEGLGPKKIKMLWEDLKIRNIEDLEQACISHKVCKLPGFQEKTEQNLLKGIDFAKRSKNRYVLGFTLPFIREIENRLRLFPGVRKAFVAGSVRRMKETIGDADFLVVSDNPKKVMNFFVSMPEVASIIGEGETKTSVKLNTGMQIDVRVVPEQSFGAAMQYFTGSKDHNIALRRIAQAKGWKLSEYGLFKGGGEALAGEDENLVYKKLGLQWIPPELRENMGEVELASQGKLPRLVDYNDLKGDLQVHSNWTDGSNTIEEMALEAKKIGLEYIVMSDHSKSLAMTGGMNEKMLLKQGKEIEKLNQKIDGIEILKGVELNILKDGSLDIEDKVLEDMDVVGASIHSHFNMDKDDMTKRVLRAIENPNVDILYHPTSRQIQRREPVQLDIERIFQAAKDTGTILDIDSYPDRLDLRDEHIKKAIEIGAKLGVSSDSHTKINYHYLELGIGQARRGWARTENIVNTRGLKDFAKFVKSPLTLSA
ncbi:MAG: DNA polymerase/3'-5' exonuclease PolX [Nitrososphaerota archaeon]|nr:DNA polymerase/3'-5' exonuclease PolX [Nitrososphaerota archaeon]